MRIFDTDWVKLHKSACDLYENIAIENYENDPSAVPANVFGIISRIVQTQLPGFDKFQASQFVEQEYDIFKKFDVYDTVSAELRNRNPSISEKGIRSIVI